MYSLVCMCFACAQMLLLKYNDNYDLFDDGERSEFIFRIFKHVVLGGDYDQVGGSDGILDH